MRPSLLIVLAGLLIAVASGTSSACEVSGRYSSSGTYYNGSPFVTEVEITGSQGTCSLRWPNSAGSGSIWNGQLEVRFAVGSESGTAIYTLMSDGSLDGTWWMDQSPGLVGSERLVPIASSRSGDDDGSAEAIGAILLLGILGAIMAPSDQPAEGEHCYERVISSNADGTPNTIWVCE